MRFFAGLFAVAGALALYCAAASAETPAAPAKPSAPSARDVPEQELERLLGPVALYPDTLLSLVLMAATYPSEVTEAASWSKRNSGVQGEAAVRAAMRQPWDTSVKTLTGFPLLLAQMQESMDWTRRLGEVYLARETDMLETVQKLRRRALAAGHLRSGELAVERRGAHIVIEQAGGAAIHVPHYSPPAVYGPATSTQHPSIEWPAWPGYTRRGAMAWGPAVPMSRGFVYAGFDWDGRHAHIASIRNYAPVAAWSPARKSEEAQLPASSSESPETKRDERAAEMKPRPAAPATPPVPLVELIPPPVPPRADSAPAQAAAPREPAATRPAPLVDLAKPKPVVIAKAAPNQAAIPPAEQAAERDAGASLIRLMPDALAPTPAQPRAAPESRHAKPSPPAAPARSEGGRPDHWVERHATEPASPTASEASGMRAPLAVETQRPEIAAIKREEAAVIAIRTEQAARTFSQETAASATPAAKPRPRVFASDADRRTLDGLPGLQPRR